MNESSTKLAVYFEGPFLDIENRELVRNVIEILLAITPMPKRKNKQL